MRMTTARLQEHSKTTLSEFSRGFHHLEVNLYAAECYFELGKSENNASYFSKALLLYQTVISEGSGSQLETALVRAGFITFNHQQNYSLAQQYYRRLSEIGGVQSNVELALGGYLRSSIGTPRRSRWNYRCIRKDSADQWHGKRYSRFSLVLQRKSLL